MDVYILYFATYALYYTKTVHSCPVCTSLIGAGWFPLCGGLGTTHEFITRHATFWQKLSDSWRAGAGRVHATITWQSSFLLPILFASDKVGHFQVTSWPLMSHVVRQHLRWQRLLSTTVMPRRHGYKEDLSKRHKLTSSEKHLRDLTDLSERSA